MAKRKRQENKVCTISNWDGFVCKQCCVLDPSIWNNLPTDIHLKLFEHLPLPALLRFRAVCKAWYNGITGLDQVTVHGQCYVARVFGEAILRIYSGRLCEGALLLPDPPWALSQRLVCTTGDGLVYSSLDWTSCIFNLFTQKMISIPAPPQDLMRIRLKFARVVSGQDGQLTIIHVLGDGSLKWMLVYESGRGVWETSRLQLPPGEEFSKSQRGSHATIDGSILYFLTVNVRTQQMSAIRWIDFRSNVDGTSTKLLSWPTLPPSYVLYQHRFHHVTCVYTHGPPFTGNIAVAGGKLFMACLRVTDPAKPNLCTVALLACDKQQGKKWDFVSEMPHTKGFLKRWRPKANHFVELRSQGDMLVVRNFGECCAWLYNTSTNAWSTLGRNIIDACPLKLSIAPATGTCQQDTHTEGVVSLLPKKGILASNKQFDILFLGRQSDRAKFSLEPKDPFQRGVKSTGKNEPLLNFKMKKLDFDE